MYIYFFIIRNVDLNPDGDHIHCKINKTIVLVIILIKICGTIFCESVCTVQAQIKTSFKIFNNSKIKILYIQ